MKKLITLTLICIMSLSLITTSFAEIPLKYETLKLEKLTTNQNGAITAITLKDDSRGLTLSFMYYDTKDTVKSYKSASYQYDYTNNLLLIKDKNGITLWDELEL